MKRTAAQKSVIASLMTKSPGLIRLHLHLPNVCRMGNPVLSDAVVHYMTSLKKRKTKAGERSVSVRALVPDEMEALYKLTLNQGRVGMRNYLVYLLSYLCLLRLDETLNILTRHIEYHPGQHSKIKFTLAFRKTQQSGGKLIFLNS
jgi:integrase